MMTRYGSFYLHMGVAGFSVGSIVYSCLQVGGYFDLSGDCQLLIIAVKPALKILFMVVQTVFIFSYNDVLHPMRGMVLDRFGLMHLIATNVCEWLNVVIQETRDDIITVALDQPSYLPRVDIDTPPVLAIETGQNSIVTTQIEDIQNVSILMHNYKTKTYNGSWTCNVSNIIMPLIRTVNPYLRPCGVEYSLLCSIIIAVIWNDLCTVPGSKCKKPEQTLQKEKCCNNRVKSNYHFSVDCGSAHKGLFMGIAVLAGTIVSLMLFGGLYQNPEHVELALLQEQGKPDFWRGDAFRGDGSPRYTRINVWETILFIMMAVGSATCIQRMRKLALRRAVTALPLEHAMLLVTQCGVYLYYLFQIIGASFVIQRYSEGRRATRIISPLCAIIQSSCQTLLVLDAWSRRTDGARRPGRQLVTFLLVGNFALWLLNRVKNARAEFHPLQMEFYGVWAWTLITHVSVPLLVCYRFQATVCFYEIWKNSYKIKKEISGDDSEEIELKAHHGP
ncbi:Proton channel OtopLc [Eumeta japonica]|uniref:Proton channel OtopLc n=1 Tax=Eumeta variegata TaxID=151549 RepID=A0A4C1VAJ7_EUMVA|nr:Proton channel OtopLc [Eumeta japonica]